MEYAVNQHEGVFIGDQWHHGGGDLFESISPSDFSVRVWQGREADSAQIDQAISAAREAFPAWRDLSVDKRFEYLLAFVKQLKAHKEALADIIGLETGKPLAECRGEVDAMVAKVGISKEAFFERTGTRRTETATGQQQLSHRPHGVVAVFGPFNFPGHLPNGHIAPALLAGNTVVFKPSEQTPLTAIKTTQLWRQAGLPEGVLNLVNGGRRVGENLSQHSQIDGLFFTGSAATGEQLHRGMAGQLRKILALETGGNNPLIVSQVSEVDAAVCLIIQSAFVSAGQRCTCARRLFVPTGPEGDRLLQRLAQVAERVRVGGYNQSPAPYMGPVINRETKESLLSVQRQLINQGAQPLLSMQSLNDNNALLTPGLLDVTAIEEVADEEWFGPLLLVHRYDAMEQAMAQANNTRFGLSAGLISASQADFDYVYRHSRAGIVNWNRPLTGASSAMPFGGIGESGNHRPSAYYAADYCAYPVASMLNDKVEMPTQIPSGLDFS